MVGTTGESYEEALSWIHSTMRFGSKLGLERIRKLVELLGHPERHSEYVHVAGTNGKGSVTAMVASALSANGYRTGRYISPYLEDFRERIAVQDKMISREDLVELVGIVRPAVEEMVGQGEDHPTEFEIVTALAFLYYARQGCDYVALEVGLGGRFDATNIVTPAVSVITTISLDHTDRLGNTVGKIAWEKAGIIKPGVPVVTGTSDEEALRVIRARAEGIGSPLFTVSDKRRADVTWEEVSYSMEGQVINIQGPAFRYENVRVPLLGRHQQANAAVAVAALEFGRPKNRDGRFRLDRSAVRHGIATTQWPGRMEVMSKHPLIILDGAHNPEGAKALRDTLVSFPKKRTVCVVGILGDKSYKEATSLIAPLCDEVIVTKPDTPRSLDPDLLAAEVKRYLPSVTVEPDLHKALEEALKRTGQEDMLLVSGSLYLVGSARTYISSKLGMTRRSGT
ncbi:MAG: bifunctional folylpolyglutamate synthase/dihydrofolate synthase [Bacillota bacterium]|jgi:dihydrofolate synthase/folylpolyglutamate synthase|nr:bifunctional folylpolyglutamate synthase/dihydrofolate synthase [Candidatus Fermentithermobacillaceae bacterium]